MLANPLFANCDPYFIRLCAEKERVAKAAAEDKKQQLAKEETKR